MLLLLRLSMELATTTHGISFVHEGEIPAKISHAQTWPKKWYLIMSPCSWAWIRIPKNLSFQIAPQHTKKVKPHSHWTMFQGKHILQKNYICCNKYLAKIIKWNINYSSKLGPAFLPMDKWVLHMHFSPLA